MVDWFQKVVDDGLTTIRTAETAKRAWQIASEHFDRLFSHPACGVGSKGEIICCWDRGTDYLEVEIHESSVEWFYKNRSTRELAAWDLNVDDRFLPDALIQKFRQLSK